MYLVVYVDKYNTHTENPLFKKCINTLVQIDCVTNAEYANNIPSIAVGTILIKFRCIMPNNIPTIIIAQIFDFLLFP